MAKLEEVFSPEQIDGFQRLANASWWCSEPLPVTRSGKMLIPDDARWGRPCNQRQYWTGLSADGIGGWPERLLAIDRYTNPAWIVLRAGNFHLAQQRQGWSVGICCKPLLGHASACQTSRAESHNTRPHARWKQSSVTPIPDGPSTSIKHSPLPRRRRILKAKVTKAAKDTKLDPKLMTLKFVVVGWMLTHISEAGAVGHDPVDAELAAGMGVIMTWVKNLKVEPRYTCKPHQEV